jgi:hypothetical protein
MHVLVTESVFGDADAARRELCARGHEVSTCHGDGGVCRAVAPGGTCPLDAQRPVDLVIDVRGLDGKELTTREYGAVCAIRAGVPLALLSTIPSQRPPLPAELARHAWTYPGDQLGKACADVQDAPRAVPGTRPRAARDQE